MTREKRGTGYFLSTHPFKKVACPLFLLMMASMADASEVIRETGTSVVVRTHPKTGKPYVSIVPSDQVDSPGLFKDQKKYPAPDYRMLDPRVKSAQFSYEGPSSDRTKVYLFAASIATLGAASGAAVIAAAPAATGTAAAGGAGAYAAGGAAVAAGSAAAAGYTLTTDPKKEDYHHVSQSKLVKKESGKENSDENRVRTQS